MTISDLNYMEVVAEASSIVGGKKLDIDVKLDQKQNQKVKFRGKPGKDKLDLEVTTQVAIPTSVAVARNGKAVAEAKGENNF